MKILPIVIMLLLANFDFSDMSIEDDAFHDELPFHIETWYFEAISGNESMVFMITLIGKMAAMIGIQFYEKGMPLYDGRKIYFSFNASNKIPYCNKWKGNHEMRRKWKIILQNFIFF